MSLSIAEFFDRLRDSGLLPPAEVDALESRVPERKRGQDVARLIPKLVEAEKLTQCQAEALLEGKGHMLVLGDYVVLHKIGSGGMGQVFKARHRRMKRLVALKVLPPQVTEKIEAVKRFQREVEAAAKLSHPNIVAAYDAGEQKGIHYLVMEYVEGEDLDHLVHKHGPLDVATAHSYVLQAALGLAHAHEQGVIHRDIKPANLLVDPHGVVKILDMGLARIEGLGLHDGSEGALTQSGSLMGTIDYMSPEQALDTKSADVRSDVYSLGCTFFFLLTGRRMYEGDTMMKRLVAHRDHPLPSLAAERFDLPPGLAEVFRRMVAKRPQDRFQTMHEVTAALLAARPEPAAVLAPRAPAAASAMRVLPLGDESVSGLPPAPPLPPRLATEQTVNEQMERETQVAAPPVLLPDHAIAASNRASTTIAPGREHFPLVLWGILALGVIVLAGLAVWGWYLMNRPKPEEDLDKLLAESKTIVDKTTPKTRRGSTTPAMMEGAVPAAGEIVTNGIGMKLAFVPGDLFTMGSPETEQGRTDEEFEHDVDLTRNFYLGAYEVTQREYQTIMGTNPSYFSAQGEGKERVAGLDTSDFPVESVSWEEAQEFCRRLSTKEGKTYRLPSEAEWEFACRDGAFTPFHFGDALNGKQANCDGNFPYGAIAKGPFLNRTSVVGSYAANAYGLFDMHGNVREWCADWHGESYYRDSPLEDPPGPSFGTTRVIRGGGWSFFADACRAAARQHFAPTRKEYDYGFRVAREP